MTLGRKYKESTRSNVGNARRENFHGYRTDKIQEEPGDLDMYSGDCKEDMDNNITENGSMSEGTSISICNSKTNLMDTTATTSSVSARSCETSPTESSSNLGDYGKSVCKADISKSFENRLLAAENLIKESKLKNLTPQRFNPNLSCNYKDTDKCDKEALITSDPSLANSVTSKRRSCIPSLRLRSGSLTREPSASTDRRKSFAGAQDASAGGANQERSILSKFFRSGSSSKEIEAKDNNKSQKPKQHRISRFLRPDFFDTPREESQYVKEKEAQKAAENERRKSRFMRRKSESKERKEDTAKDEKICKEQKNEINALQKDKLDSTTGSPTEDKSKSEEKEKTKIVRQSSKSSFLHSLEKKLERLRSNDESTSTIAKPTMNGNVPGDRKERGARECSAPPVECPTVESTLTEVKRTLSVEDLSLNKSTKSSPSAKAKVTSVLGLFKTNADTKQNANGRSQNAIMSKLKRSPPKCAKSMESPLEEDAAATSKIPTKFTRTDNKSVKKVPESKKSPPKEKSKERELIVKERKPMERQSREFKRAPEKSDSSFADKAKQEKTESLRKSSDDSESLQKVVDNKQAESIANNEDKKLVKTKKNISSLDKNGSVTRIDKGADVDKKIKKPVIPKEETDKEEINGAKKKRIVRVVKKVVKKSSDSSESKSEEKEKSRPLMKKKIVTTRKEKSPEGPTGTAQNSVKGNNVDNQTATRSSHLKQTQPNVQEISSAKSSDAAEPSVQNTITMPKPDAVLNSSNANVSAANLSQTASALQNTSSPQNCASSVVQNVSNSILATSAASITQNASNFNINQAKPPEQHRANRASLKLDLSKIPQHTFRHATPKRESPKSESPKANSAVSIGSPKTDAPAVESSSDKLMDCLSKMTHHANITGNKIIIDKPLRAKDVAELKREVTECAKIIENHVELQNDCSTSQNIDKVIDSGKPIADERSKEIAMNPPKETSEVVKEPTLDDCTSEMFSPEEPESFDSWSICSADLNHNRSDLHSPQLHSPTSPSYSLFMRGDSSESVIDRIRRRSFYSRFNDRKRPSLTAPPPGISSVTLPRRFSFNSSRERERSRLYNYGVPRTRSDKSYLYGDEVSCRKSPVDRERYSDTLNTSSYGHHSPEARSIFDHYGNSVPSTSHDSLRRYVRSPTLDLVTSRAKYHSSDIIADNDLTGSYKSPLSRSMLNESMTDSYCGRSTSSTLPRKFGSTVGNLEPKSVEYYEEILSPSNADYLSPRDTCRSPLLDGYLSRCENGYHHNGNLDLPQFDKQKSYTNKMTDVELGEGNSRLGEQKRNIMRRLSETRDTPSTTADILSNLSVTEQD